MFNEHLDRYYPDKPETISIDEGLTEIIEGKFYSTKIRPNDHFKALRSYKLNKSDKLVSVNDGKESYKYIGLKKKNGKSILILKRFTSMRNNRRTNFPRDLVQKEDYTWGIYYEALVILKPLYDEMVISFRLDKGKRVDVFDIPVDGRYLDMPPGESFGIVGGFDGKPVIPDELDRTYESPLSYILRELFKRLKLTRKELSDLTDAHIANPLNVLNYTSKPSNIKLTILKAMFNWDVSFTIFLRALMILNYEGVDVEINARKELRTRTKIGKSLISLRLKRK